MIRQAISCDVCGTEMLNANHWFIAREHGRELRITIWSGQARLGNSARHLCGHKCLHKYLDDFLAQNAQPRPSMKLDSVEKVDFQASAGEKVVPDSYKFPVIGSCAVEPESSAHLVPARRPAVERLPLREVRTEVWKREMERQNQQQLTHRRSGRGAFSMLHSLVRPAEQDD